MLEVDNDRRCRIPEAKEIKKMVWSIGPLKSLQMNSRMFLEIILGYCGPISSPVYAKKFPTRQIYAKLETIRLFVWSRKRRIVFVLISFA